MATNIGTTISSVSSMTAPLLDVIFSYPIILLVSGGAVATGIWNTITVNDEFDNSMTSTQNLYQSSDEYRYTEYLTALFTQFTVLSGGIMFSKEKNIMYQITTVVFLLLSVAFIIGHVSEETKEVRMVYNIELVVAALSVFILAMMQGMESGFFSSPLTKDASTDSNYLSSHGWCTAMRGAAILATAFALSYVSQVVNIDNLQISVATSNSAEMDVIDIFDATRYVFQPFLQLSLLYFGYQVGSGNSDKKGYQRLFAVAIIWVGIFVTGIIAMLETAFGSKEYHDVELALGILYFSFSYLISLVMKADYSSQGDYTMMRSSMGHKSTTNYF